MSKWYGKVIFTGDSTPGVVHMKTYKSKAEAKAFSDGFTKAKEEIKCGLSDGDFNPLEEYYSTHDQILPTVEV